MKLAAHKKMLSTAAAASVLLLTAACGAGSGSDSTTPTSEASSPGDTSSSDAASYKDGDYSGESSYSNPAGSSKLKVEVVLAGGNISDITVTPEATNGTSKQYQTQFAGGVADEVVGKSLNEIKVSKVAGSSLTSLGFNQAIDKIKAEAKA